MRIIVSASPKSGGIKMNDIWRKCKKKPLIIEYREPKSPYEIIKTLEGDMVAHPGVSVILRGIEGELYPIKKTIFDKSFDLVDDGMVNYNVSNPKLPCETGESCDALKEGHWCSYHDVQTWYLPECCKMTQNTDNARKKVNFKDTPKNPKKIIIHFSNNLEEKKE